MLLAIVLLTSILTTLAASGPSSKLHLLRFVLDRFYNSKTNTEVNSAFHPYEVGKNHKLSTALFGVG